MAALEIFERNAEMFQKSSKKSEKIQNLYNTCGVLCKWRILDITVNALFSFMIVPRFHSV